MTIGELKSGLIYIRTDTVENAMSDFRDWAKAALEYMEDLEARISKNETDKESSNESAIVELTEEMQSLEKRISSVEESIDDDIEEIKAAEPKETPVEIVSQDSGWKDPVGELTTRVKALEGAVNKDVSGIEEQMEKLQDDVDRIINDTISEEKVTTLIEQVRKLKRNLENMPEIGDMDVDLEDMEDRLDGLEDLVEKRNEEYQKRLLSVEWTLRDDGENFIAAIQNLQSTLKKVIKAVKEMRGDIKELKEKTGNACPV